MDTDLIIRDLAERQHGAFAREQAILRGVASKALLRRTRRGVLVPRGARVLIVSGTPSTPRQRLTAAVLDAGLTAAASHEAAAALWELPGFSPGPLDVSRTRGAWRGVPMFCELHEPCHLPDHHITTVDGVRVTTLARTVLDCAGTLRPERLERMVDNVCTRAPGMLAALHRMFAELARSGRPGIAAMRELLDERPVELYVPPASGLEARVIRLLEDEGICTERQVDLGAADHWIGRVDLRVIGTPLVLEIDSVVHHWSKTDRERDAERDAQLAAAGLRVERLTEDDVFHRPWMVGPRVRRALAELGAGRSCVGIGPLCGPIPNPKGVVGGSAALAGEDPVGVVHRVDPLDRRDERVEVGGVGELEVEAHA